MFAFSAAQYQQWLKDTDLGFGKMRSSHLKKLDAALLTYTKTPTPANASAIAKAIDDWDRSRGTATPSERDKNGAITTLRIQLETGGASGDSYRAANFSKEELDAFKMVMDAKKNQLVTTFSNASVHFVGNKPDLEGPVTKLRALLNKGKAGFDKGQSAYGTASDVFNAGSKAATIGQKIAPVASVMGKASAALAPIINGIKDALLNMAETIFGVAMGVLGAVGQHILTICTQIAGMVAPYVSHLMDAKDMIMGWGKTAVAAIKTIDISNRSNTLDTGSPAAAMEGVVTCLKAEVGQQAAQAMNATVSFTLKTVFAAGDYGAGSQIAVGIGSALVELTRQIMNLALEWRATKKIKTILANPSTLDISVFKVYPLMGAYMLTSVNLSDALPLTMFGTPGWMDMIEKEKKGNFDKIYAACEDLIQKSKWEIAGLPKRRIMKVPTKAGLKYGASLASGLAGGIKDTLLG